MATFLLLANFTDQGIRNVKETTRRAKAFREVAAKAGAQVKEMYWTMGRCDVVAVFEAPDDETMFALAAGLGSKGNVHTETMRAFSADEMDRILGKMVV